jgi:hypothetical protein
LITIIQIIVIFNKKYVSDAFILFLSERGCLFCVVSLTSTDTFILNKYNYRCASKLTLDLHEEGCIAHPITVVGFAGIYAFTFSPTDR